MLTLPTISQRSLFSLALILGIATILVIGCSAPAAPTAAPYSSQPRSAAAQPTAAPAQPTSAPAATSAPALTTVGSSSGNAVPGGGSNAAPLDRKIIKNAQLS